MIQRIAIAGAGDPETRLYIDRSRVVHAAFHAR
jgi:hypothetical protein